MRLSVNGEMWGPAVVLLSRRGIRIKARIGDALLLPQQADVATLINPENKTYLPVSFPDYRDDLREGFRKPPRIERFEISSGKGAQVKTYRCFAHEHGKDIKTAEFACMPMIDLPLTVQKMWKRFFYLDDRDWGMPVAVNQMSHKHVMMNIAEHAWQTSEKNRMPTNPWIMVISMNEVKKVPVDARSFELPKGFTKARDRASLYLSVDGDIKPKDIEDLFRVPMK